MLSSLGTPRKSTILHVYIEWHSFVRENGMFYMLYAFDRTFVREDGMFYAVDRMFVREDGAFRATQELPGRVPFYI